MLQISGLTTGFGLNSSHFFPARTWRTRAKFSLIVYICLRLSECMNPFLYNMASTKMRKASVRAIGQVVFCICRYKWGVWKRQETRHENNRTERSVRIDPLRKYRYNLKLYQKFVSKLLMLCVLNFKVQFDNPWFSLTGNCRTNSTTTGTGSYMCRILRKIKLSVDLLFVDKSRLLSRALCCLGHITPRTHCKNTRRATRRTLTSPNRQCQSDPSIFTSLQNHQSALIVGIRPPSPDCGKDSGKVRKFNLPQSN